MSPRRRGIGPVPVLLLLILLFVAYYLSRWRYVGTQMRYDRLTGRTEQRIEHNEDYFEWQVLPNFKYGKPAR